MSVIYTVYTNPNIKLTLTLIVIISPKLTIFLRTSPNVKSLTKNVSLFQTTSVTSTIRVPYCMLSLLRAKKHITPVLYDVVLFANLRVLFDYL